MDDEKLGFKEMELNSEPIKEKKKVDELGAGLLSLLFAGISLAMLPVFLKIVGMKSDDKYYGLVLTFAIICIIIDFAVFFLQIFYTMRLYIRYQRERKSYSYGINCLCGAALFIIFAMIVLGIIFMM